jgi:hypothetical protein
MTQPTRPNDDGRVNAVAWIEVPGEAAPRGVVYQVPDGRLFFLAIDRDSGMSHDKSFRHLLSLSINSPPDGSGVTNLLPDALGELGDKADPETQRWLDIAMCGREIYARAHPELSLT